MEEISRVEEFLTGDPRSIGAGGRSTVQVEVPRVAVDGSGGGDGGAGGDGEESRTAQTKRAELQRMAAVASLAAEDYARKFEAGDLKV